MKPRYLALVRIRANRIDLLQMTSTDTAKTVTLAVSDGTTDFQKGLYSVAANQGMTAAATGASSSAANSALVVYGNIGITPAPITAGSGATVDPVGNRFLDIQAGWTLKAKVNTAMTNTAGKYIEITGTSGDY
jgi:hypothetical protein